MTPHVKVEPGLQNEKPNISKRDDLVKIAKNTGVYNTRTFLWTLQHFFYSHLHVPMGTHHDKTKLISWFT